MKQTILEPAETMQGMTRRLLLILPIWILTTGYAFGQTTWTGATDQDWNKAANWLDGVPGSDDAVIIPAAAHAPTISGSASASAKSVLVEVGASLLIENGSSLTLNGSADYTTPFAASSTLNNLGTVTNGGTLVIGSEAGVGAYGITNQGAFTNQPDGVIRIDRTTDTGLYVVSGDFANEGEINIGSAEPVGFHGIWNDGAFLNNTDGMITVDRSTLRGLMNNSNTFDNAGKVTIGGVADVGSNGVENKGALTNAACAQLLVFRGNLANETAATVVNSGLVRVKSTLTNNGTFTNNGVLNPDNVAGNIVNNQLIIVHEASLLFSYGPAFSGTIEGIFTDEAATQSAGVFTAPNTFVPASPITQGQLLYAKVLMDGGAGCTFITETTIAVSTTWTGAVSSAWDDAGNWTSGVPQGGQPAVIAAVNTSPVIAAGVNARAKSLLVQAEATLTIEATGTLAIDDSELYNTPSDITAALNNLGTVVNRGEIKLGATGSVGDYGIVNQGTFSNAVTGSIKISRSTESAIFNASGSFSNEGGIEAGDVEKAGRNAIWNDAAFDNKAGGVINFGLATVAGINNNGTFSTAGQIMMGGVFSPGNNAIVNNASFTIEPCGRVYIYRGDLTNNSSKTVTNKGLLYMTTRINSDGTFINDGVLRTAVFAGNLTNNQISVNQTAEPDIFEYGGGFTGNVEGIYLDEAGTQSAGQFTAPNTFVPNYFSGTSITMYAKITLGGSACTYMVGFSYAARETQWTGNVGTSWSDAANWSNGVPDALSRTVINPSDNQPMIEGDAFAKSIYVQSGASLTVNEGGDLTVKGTDLILGKAAPFSNVGTVENNGKITLHEGSYGIVNQGIFNNNVTGNTAIHNSTGSDGSGIVNDNGTFTNSGEITIEKEGPQGPWGLISYGIDNTGTFTNNAGGTIQIETATYYGVDNGGTFTNEGEIRIGSVTMPNIGLNNNGNFANKTGGKISIERADATGLANGGTFINEALIAIAETLAVKQYAFVNNGIFQNKAGAITIDHTSVIGFINNNSFTNDASLTITGATDHTGIQNTGSFVNSSKVVARGSSPAFSNAEAGTLENKICGSMLFSGGVINQETSNIQNDGYLLIGGQLRNNGAPIPNNGILKYGSLIGNITNNQLIVNATSTLIFTYGTDFNATIGGIFQDEAGTQSAGVFTAPNTFVPGDLPDEVITLYAKIKLSGAECIQMVPFQHNTPEPEILIKGNNEIIPNGDTSPRTADYTDFGGQFFDAGHIMRTFTIENAGSADLMLDGPPYATINGDPDFAITVQPNNFSVSPGGNRTFEVRFDPTTLGDKTATITINSNDVINGSYTFTIKGTGTNDCQPVTTTGAITWTGAVSSDWNSPCNWSPTAVPGPQNLVLIPETENMPVIGDGTAAAHTVELTANVTLTIADGASLKMEGLYNPGTILNSGQLTLGNAEGTESLQSIGTLTNAVCGQLFILSNIDNRGTFTNNGSVVLTALDMHLNSGTLLNNGVISFPKSNPIPSVTNHGIVLLPGLTSTCETLVDAFETGNGPALKITGIFADAEATTSAGTFDATANSFTPTENSAEGIQALFVRVEDEENECVRILPWQLTLTKCCIPPVFAAPTVTVPSYPVTTGSIVINATSEDELEYSVDNGDNWFDSNAFSNLAVGSYHLKARVKSLPACESAYSGNPVVFTEFVTAADIWTGNVSGDWANAGNWQDGSVPTAGDDVTVPAVERKPVIGDQIAAAAKSVLIEKNTSLTLNTGAKLTINGSALYRSLESGASPLDFTAGFNNLGEINNSGLIVLGSVGSVGSYGIVNQGNIVNKSGGQVSVDWSEDTGIYNAAGTFTNEGVIKIGREESVGNHGIWNDAIFTNSVNSQISINRSALRALMNNADESKSIQATLNNSGTIVIGAEQTVGKTGIENLSAFNNNPGGDIQVNGASENAVYQASGQFINDAEIKIGNVQSAGSTGLAVWGGFINNPDGALHIDQVNDFGIRNAAGTFVNKGKIFIGEATNGGKTGFENVAVVQNIENGEIHIDRNANMALHHISGSISNASLIVIGGKGSVGRYGIWTEAAFDNNTNGDIRIDNISGGSAGVGFYHLAGNLKNAGKVAIGGNAVGGHAGLSVVGAARFENVPAAVLRIDRTAAEGISITNGTLDNSGQITIGSIAGVGKYGLYNGGTFTNNTGENNARGELRIDRSTLNAIFTFRTFNNNADIVIGSAAPVGPSGIESRGNVQNNAGGIIRVDRSTSNAMANVIGTFANAGALVFGANESVGDYGILNSAVFQNLGSGSLRIDRANKGGIFQKANNSGITNEGEITLGAVASVGEVGIETHTSFTNSAGGHIRIDHSTDIGLSVPAGTFTNEADITIGEEASAGRYGLVNRATFNHNSGHIRIDRTTDTGLYGSGGTFTNHALITIGGLENVGVHGIFNEAAFINNEEGHIHIDRTTAAGLRNFNGTFTNAASVTIGSKTHVGTYGIRNQAAFENNAGGVIRVDNAAQGIFLEDNIFANAGTVTIGGIVAIADLITRQGTGDFSNNANGIFKASGRIAAAGFSNAGGTLSPGYSPGKLTFDEAKDFSNSITDIEINGPGVAGVDYDQIEVLGTATLGGTLKLSTNYIPADGDEVIILSASAISGTFATITGSNRWRIDYSDNAIRLVYDVTLPVDLAAFEAKQVGSAVQLQWRTASEIDNAGFHIERSTNGLNWQDIGFREGYGTVAATKDYRFADNSPVPGINYYRLRQVDFDGKTEHSRIQAVRFMTAQSDLIVWADDMRQAHIKTEEIIEKVTVFDLTGRVWAVSDKSTFSLLHAPAGILLVRIQTKKGVVSRKLLLF
ncbi:choice-of-anchor D domain-containing protein [Dyadobacter aurulentus]|uniref:choice-of-anchor D domain-containing protein n=1 Tax=Dyadobacter sp. UC 10 TaxID=2605428 RepID=UPI0011F1220E|nr:choice-of-anchor D domain-containing protein [Dyadobacter sp. UC 10]KAA0993473.1 choice-of-anchor D domain-containing protein [Dyadobacter sp. UC 10]